MATSSEVSDSSTIENFTSKSAEAVKSILVAIQNIVKISEKEEEIRENEEENDKLLLNEHLLVLRSVRTLYLNEVNEKLFATVAAFYQIKSSNSVRNSYLNVLRNFCPLIHQLCLLTQNLFLNFLRVHKSFCKLEYVLLSVFNTLYLKGFCRKPDQDDEEEGETQEGEGTGIGEGTGKEDVSHEIENEDQIMGDGTEQPVPPEEQEKREIEEDDETGVEVDQDFEGEMLDVKENERKEDEMEDEDEMEEMDRQMGDLKGEEETKDVDKELWDQGEQEEEQEEESKSEQQEEDKIEKDASISGIDNLDIEWAAQEEEQEEEEQGEKKEQELPAAKGDENEGENPPEEETDMRDDEDAEMDETAPKERPEDMFEENLGMDIEIPEELQLDGDEEMEDNNLDQQDESEEDEGEGDKEDVEMQDVEEEEFPAGAAGAEEETEDFQEHPEEEEKEEDEEQSEKMEAESVDYEENQHPPESTEELPLPEEAEKQEETKDEVSGQMPGEQTREVAMEEEEEEPEPEPEEKEGEEEEEGREAPLPSDQMDEHDTSPQQKENDPTGTEFLPGHDDQQQLQPQQEQHQSPPSSLKDQPNPYRSLGDVLKKWQERIEVVENKTLLEDEAKTQYEESPEMDEDEIGTFEHVPEDQQADTQALATQEEEVPRETPEILKKEEEEREEQEVEDHRKDLMEDEGEDEEIDKSKQKEKSSKQKSISSLKREIPIIEAEKEKSEKKEEELSEGEPVEEESTLSSSVSTSQMNLLHLEEVDEEKVDEIRVELDEHFDRRVSENESFLNGEELWRKFQLVTEDLSLQLCEQLRSILEPTLASKLRGDYRTGKRINMKKVIPYIASQFRKDKIWLRRSKPSKREYQIMIAIDDSESMNDRGCTRLALEALVAVSRALTQLEAGDICVARLGTDTEFLHSFNQPFTDDSGAHCVSKFTFRQRSTMWSTFLRKMTAYLEVSQQSLSSARGHEHPQLVFVITDGAIQEDRTKITNLVRDAYEKRQMLVAIIVDSSLPQQNLIEFIGDKVNSKPFLEDYPIPHYIILRDVSHLPDVLADGLRQWFELLNHSHL